METLTKTEAEAILERLADKTAAELYRCNRVWDAWNFGTMTREDFEAVEPPILIGDVLEKMEKMIKGKFGDKALSQSYASIGSIQYQWQYWMNTESQKLMNAWSNCGFTKSLQEIASQVEYEEHDEHCTKLDFEKCLCPRKRSSAPFAIAKPSAATSLFEFLINLQLTK